MNGKTPKMSQPCWSIEFDKQAFDQLKSDILAANLGTAVYIDQLFQEIEKTLLEHRRFIELASKEVKCLDE